MIDWFHLRRLWKRGATAWWYALPVWILTVVFIWPVGWIELIEDWVSDPWATVISLISTGVMLVILCTLLPLAVAKLQVGPHSVRESMAQRLEPLVDALARCDGVVWSQQAFADVEALLQDRQWNQARRRWKHHTGQSWQEVTRDLENWPATVVKAKLEVLAETAIERGPSPCSGPSGAQQPQK